MQQPKEQYEDDPWHGGKSEPQTCSPLSQVAVGGGGGGGGSPGGGGGISGVQLAGRSAVVLPAQSSHWPHVFPHCVVLVQRGQALASVALSTEHVALSVTSTLVPLASSIVQQPKQSQPFGVRR